MILIDAIFINNSGGKILLDYLIEILERKKILIHYLLDERIRNNHPEIASNKVTYLRAGLLNRHKFYKKNQSFFTKVLCFGNLPPTLRIDAKVYTYFHQKLFLEISNQIPFKQKIILYVKSLIFTSIQKNTDFWIVQTETMKDHFLKKMKRAQRDFILIIPFYPPLINCLQNNQESVFIYVSSGNHHKNHYMLLEGFRVFFDKNKQGELHLTISEEFSELCDFISKMVLDGYPIINHGFIPREKLSFVYAKASYAVYPSLSESFGLGIVEAIENHCDIIGADLPYTFAVCTPSLVFDPLKAESIANALQIALEKKINPTRQLVFNEIDNLINLLK